MVAVPIESPLPKPFPARVGTSRGSVRSFPRAARPAVTRLPRALPVAKVAGSRLDPARALASLGLARLEMGQYAAALSALDEAGSLFRARGLDHEAIWTAYRRADCYLLQGRYDEALDVLAAVEPQIARSDDEADALAVATRRVAALLHLGREAEALAVLEAAESRSPVGAPEHGAWLAVQRAALLLRRGMPADALAGARRARELARGARMRRLCVEAYLLEGEALLAQGDVSGARRIAARAHRLCRRAGAPPLLHRSNLLLARVAEAQGRHTQARRRYRAAIEHLERERMGVILDFRASFARGRTDAYERLALLQVERGSARAALETAERGKARSLADVLLGRLRLRGSRNPEVRRLEQALTALQSEYALAASTPTRDEVAPALRAGGAAGPVELEKRILDLRRRLQLLSAGRPDTASPNVALPRMAPGSLLVEYFFAGDEVLRFTLDSSGARAASLGPILPELQRLMQALQLNLDLVADSGGEPDPRLGEQARQILQRLFDLLLRDAEGIERCQSAVFVPHGILHHLPFPALFDGERYLIERCAVSYAPSATLYAACTAWRRTARGTPVVFAHAPYGELRAADAEAREAAAALGVRPITGEQATRRRFERRARNAPAVHLAGHAHFRPDAPLFSGIQLADGLLTTAEILNLRLLGSLVVLSACETGRSELGAGDELVGLARAFLYAGASALVVSQWCVEDRATATLMRGFYRALQAGAGRAEALRLAQLQMLSAPAAVDRTRHPFYWAGFQLIGDGGQGLDPEGS